MTNGQSAYVIAATSDAALKVAKMIESGELPALYGEREAAMSAWAHQPDPMRQRYALWRIELSAADSVATQLTDGATAY